MRKFLMTAMASAVVLGASSAAFAQCPEDSAGLPNKNWSWRTATTPDGPTGETRVLYTDIDRAGQSGVVHATVQPQMEVTTGGYQCIAVTPGGQDNLDKSLEPVAGTTTWVNDGAPQTGVKVCQNNSTDPLAGYTGTCPG
jgi:hypothetical protein